ncbi:MAG: ATP-binding protein, partial [Cyanobacteria bacterium J06558_2]
MKLALQKSHKSIRLLQDVELNDFTVLTGVNGAGKSHLLEAIENGSIKVDGIASGGNLIRRFDWSNLVPNDTQAINPYTLIQERDNHWKDISSQITRSRDSFKQFLEQIKITNKSDDEIKQMASMTELELSEKLSDHQKAHQIYVHYKSILDNFKKQYSRNNKIIYLLIERFEKVCSTPFIYLDEDEFYKYYFAQCNPVNIFQQSFGRLFAAYEKLRVENEFREFRNQRKGQNIGFLSEQEFKAQNGEPPWDFVNDILETADLDFRIDKPDGYNNKPYQPRLIHQISGDLINFSNLSSGEKILISFALFLYYAEDKNQIVNYPKILLFDEIDAPLHPSMTQSVINTIQEVLINKHKIKVILTTHSPSTVALSPESSIYVMTKDENNRLQETSKDSALAVLTAGITTLSINYENRRQIFVESKNDIEYYELIFNKIKQHLIPEISLSFISAGTKGENCEQVKSIVKQLVDCGNSNVYGIIDWDSYHASKDNIKVLGENKRYSIENYIFDPLLLVTFLLR